MRGIFRLCVLLRIFLIVECPGLLILYRPLDITGDCSFSRHLRYDLSFGMGMSDTITLVFRTLNAADYECLVEVVGDSRDVYLIIVILFPTSIGTNCFFNPNAFAVLKMQECFRLCDALGNRNELSPYYVASMRERFRFRFASNSSVNADMKAHMYQVTVTAARKKSPKETDCNQRNETICVNDGEEYCFSSGVVCDGIKNCGVADWFDERKLECGLPVEKLGIAPVFAVSAAMLCAALAATHLLYRCLPPRANSFFVFNANEDNRLYIDSVFMSPEDAPRQVDNVPRPSLVPVSSSSSSNVDSVSKLSDIISSDLDDPETKQIEGWQMEIEQEEYLKTKRKRNTTMRTVSQKIQDKLKAVTKLGKKEAMDIRINDV